MFRKILVGLTCRQYAACAEAVPEAFGLSASADQNHRWVASALVLIEPRLRRIKGYCHLPLLRAAFQARIGKAERMEGIRIA